MQTILFWIYIFLDLLWFFIFIDVILSWLTLFWINLKPRFIFQLVHPLYKWVKNIIPTNIWPLDFTPIVLILIIYFFKWLIFTLSPEIEGLIRIYWF